MSAVQDPLCEQAGPGAAPHRRVILAAMLISTFMAAVEVTVGQDCRPPPCSVS